MFEGVLTALVTPFEVGFLPRSSASSRSYVPSTARFANGNPPALRQCGREAGWP